MNLKQDLEKLAAITDTLERARVAGEMIEAMQAAQDEAGDVRRAAIEDLVRAGYRRGQLAGELGLTPSRITQILKTTNLGAERRFLDAGPMTVVIGGKHAAEKPEPVMSQDAFTAWETMRDLASRYGREAVSEVVPPPGSVRLNRPGLVVIGSPRLLPAVGRVIEGSSPYQFASDQSGWYLVDTADGHTYRSPMDEGGDQDYAHVGRLRRPDGRGYFLHVGGIHGPGTRGAAHWLATNVTDLWKAVKLGPFSVLLRVSFDGGTAETLTVEPVKPIHPLEL